MTGFDYGVLFVMGFSVLLSVLRGGVSEIISLVAWVLAFWLAQRFSPALAMHLPPDVPGPQLRLIASFLGIFLGVWLLSAIIRITVSQFIKATGLGPVDRLIGAAFGFIRGGVIIVALVLLAGMTNLPKQPIWRDAMFSPPFEAMAVALRPWLPLALSKQIKYD